MANRKPREATTRATTQRKPWAPPSKLEAPEAPAGYQHRWVRTHLVVMTTSPTPPKLREGGTGMQTSIPTWEIATQ